MMLHMKFDFNRPAGLRDIHVWKCGSTDGRQLKSHPISSPWGYGSCKLKQQMASLMCPTYLQLDEADSLNAHAPLFFGMGLSVAGGI